MESSRALRLKSEMLFPLLFLRQTSTRQRWAISQSSGSICSPGPKTSLNLAKRSLYSSRLRLQYSRKLRVSSISTPWGWRRVLRLSRSMSHSLVYSMEPSSCLLPTAFSRQKPQMLPQGEEKEELAKRMEKYLLPQTRLPSFWYTPFSSIFFTIVQLSGMVAMNTPSTSRFDRMFISPCCRPFSEPNMQWKHSCADTTSQQEWLMSLYRSCSVKSSRRVSRRQGSWLLRQRSSQVRTHYSLKSIATMYCTRASRHLGMSCPRPHPMSNTCSILLSVPVLRSRFCSMSLHMRLVWVWMRTALIQLLKALSSQVLLVSRSWRLLFCLAISSQLRWMRSCSCCMRSCSCFMPISQQIYCMDRPARAHILFDAPAPAQKDRRAQLVRMRKTYSRESPLRNPQDALPLHFPIEKRQLCRSQAGRRSSGIAKQQMPESRSSVKSRGVSRYDTQKEEESRVSCRAALQKSVTSSKLLAGEGGLRRSTEPQQQAGLKEEVLRRVGKKVDFVRLMTEEDEPAGHSESLFKFDKFYEHCLRSINKCLNLYEKDPGRLRSKKYFELKIEGGILSRELLQIRHSLLQKREDSHTGESGFGVVGSNIDVKNSEKTPFLRSNEQLFRKKPKPSRREEREFVNPFLLKETCGWETSDKAEELLL